MHERTKPSTGLSRASFPTPEDAQAPAKTPAEAPDPMARAWKALETHDWGSDVAQLRPIDDALSVLAGDAAARGALEARLAAVLTSSAPRAAKDFACRRLSRIGTAASVPTLAALLADEDLSHMARYALERMPCPEADTALRQALKTTKGKVRVGVVRSLGVRRNVDSVSPLADFLADPDPQVAAAAAGALGQIGTSDAARELRARTSEDLRRAAADASLECAERLLVAGKKEEAAAIYDALRSAQVPEHVRLAAKLGLEATSRRG